MAQRVSPCRTERKIRNNIRKCIKGLKKSPLLNVTESNYLYKWCSYDALSYEICYYKLCRKKNIKLITQSNPEMPVYGGQIIWDLKIEGWVLNLHIDDVHICMEWKHRQSLSAKWFIILLLIQTNQFASTSGSQYGIMTMTLRGWTSSSFP